MDLNREQWNFNQEEWANNHEEYLKLPMGCQITTGNSLTTTISS